MRFCKLIIIVVCLFATGLFAQAQAQAPTKSEDEKPQLKAPEEKRYKLHPGDVIEVIYRYTPEFNQTITIQPDGFVVMEIVGELKVGGLTIEQARQEIVKKASVRLKDPEVTLLLKEFQKPYFVVAGEVVQPGKFEMRENVTALQAIMLAGGFKDSAKSSQLLVFRKINSEMAEVRVLNLKGIKKTGDLENDFMLESGDMILIPRNTISKIERFIKLASLAAFF